MNELHQFAIAIESLSWMQVIGLVAYGIMIGFTLDAGMMYLAKRRAERNKYREERSHGGSTRRVS
jgi:hypothetical protein